MERECGGQRGAAPYLQRGVPQGWGGGGRPSSAPVATAEAGVPKAGEKLQSAASLALGNTKGTRGAASVIKDVRQLEKVGERKKKEQGVRRKKKRLAAAELAGGTQRLSSVLGGALLGPAECPGSGMLRSEMLLVGVFSR